MLPTSPPLPPTLLLVGLLALPAGLLAQDAEAAADTTTGSSYADGHGGEVFFPLGDLSFADEVIRFDEGDPAARDEQVRKPENLLGPPDNHEDDVERYLTMGCGGTVVVRFTDNALVNVEGPDLYVFEIGGAVEATNLAVSVDGEEWVEVGAISGGRADVDLAEYGLETEAYSFVRLTDRKTSCGRTPGADVDAVGAIGSAVRLTLSSGVLFDLNEAVLKPEARAALNELADRLADFGPSHLTVEGHTDATGPEAYNQELSRRRAAAVAAFLEGLGLPDVEIETRGYGETRPAATNETPEGRARNRRVEVVVRPVGGG